MNLLFEFVLHTSPYVTGLALTAAVVLIVTAFWLRR